MNKNLETLNSNKKQKQMEISRLKQRGQEFYSTFILAMLLIFITSLLEAQAQTIRYVRPGGTGNGASWASAYGNLETAFSNSPAGAQLWVAAGTYVRGGIESNEFNIDKTLFVYGGFNGTETDLSQRDIAANRTIISGAAFHNHVMDLSGLNGGRLDGFTITGGEADGGFFDIFYGYDGAGIEMNEGANYTFANLIFQNNFAVDDGGGFYLINSSNITFDNCTFRNNRAARGAGLYLQSCIAIRILNSEFTGNQATVEGGGGIAIYGSGGIVIENTDFQNNSANNTGGLYGGGGLYAAGESDSIRIEDCTFDSNQGYNGGNALFSASGNIGFINTTIKNGSNVSSGVGGGVYLSQCSGRQEFFNCRILNNSGGSHGGGVYYNNPYPGSAVNLVNCLVAGNICNDSWAGGLTFEYNHAGTINIINSTITNNNCPNTLGDGIYVLNQGGGTAIIYTYNVILRGNGNQTFNDQIASGGGFQLLGENNNMQGFGLFPPIITMDQDPRFVDPSGGDYRLRQGSPCIDRGGSAALAIVPDIYDLDGDGDTTEPIPIDLDGVQREIDDPAVAGDPVDMGPFETAPDCNFNRVWDELELADGSAEDCNGNGIIDICEYSLDSIACRFPATLSENLTGNSDTNMIGVPDDAYLGLGNSSVTYEFTCGPVLDSSGPDFNVYEVDNGVDEFSSVDVQVSEDGVNFFSVKATEGSFLPLIGDEAHNNPSFARSYDISVTGLPFARYIKIQGLSPSPPGGYNGFDLDAIGGFLIWDEIRDTDQNFVLDDCQGPDCNNNGILDVVDLARVDDACRYPSIASATEGVDVVPVVGPPNDLSLDVGEASFVTFRFDCASVLNRDGADFNVYEFDSGDVEFEKIDVFVSDDGVDFFSVKASEGPGIVLPDDEAHGNPAYVRSYDIEGSGLDVVRHIRIVDTKVGGAIDSGTEVNGFDLDAVGVWGLNPLQEVFYVDGGVSGGADIGYDWGNASSDLQEGLCLLRNFPGNVEEVWIAEGNYISDQGTGSRSTFFRPVGGLNYYGSLVSGATTVENRDFVGNATILSGDILGDDFIGGSSAENSYTVMKIQFSDEDMAVDGFTISGANGDNTGVEFGGGAEIRDASVTLRNIIFRDNYADLGGGLYVYDSDTQVRMEDVLFLRNQSVSAAGFYGVDAQVWIDNVVFEENRAEVNAGGMALVGNTVVMENSRFENNHAVNSAGAVYLIGATLNSSENYYLSNTANQGGGMYVDGSSYYGENDRFLSNRAASSGGAIELVEAMEFSINSSIFVANQSEDTAGALNIVAASGTIDLSSFYRNRAVNNTGAIGMRWAAVRIANSIIWDNTTEEIFDEDVAFYVESGSEPVVLYSCIMDEAAGDGSVYPGEGNIDLDPEFFDADGPDDILGTADDFLLPFVTAPVIDAGNNNLVPAGVVSDIRGENRFYDESTMEDTGVGSGGIVDMGPYEFQGTVFRVLDQIQPPDAIISDVDYEKAPWITDGSKAFAHPSIDPDYMNRVYATDVGLIDVSWAIQGQIGRVTETYFIAPNQPTVTMFRTDRNSSPQVDMSPVIDNVPAGDVVFHSNVAIEGGFILPTDNDPPDIGFIRLTNQAVPLYNLVATRAGRVVVEYRELDEPYRPIAFEYLEIKTPQPEVVELEVGDRLLPSSDEVSDVTCKPLVSRGDLNYIYQQTNDGPSKWYSFAIRPTTSLSQMEMHWYTEGVLGICWPTEVRRYTAVWPEAPQINVRSRDGVFPPVHFDAHKNITVEYTEPSNQFAATGGKKYVSNRDGWATFRYANDVLEGELNSIEVVKTVDRTHPMFADGTGAPRVTAWDIGQRIMDASHTSGCFPTGYIYSGTEYDPFLYDPEIFDDPGMYDGSDKAIFLVNEGKVEVWFFEESQDVCWPVKPLVFDAVWPATPDHCLTIANEDGIGPFGINIYGDPKIYDQPNPRQLGFNPNDEHAEWVLLPGDRIFAGRDDLYDASQASKPYTLLRYKNLLQDSEWEFDVIGVHASNTTGGPVAGCECEAEPCDFDYDTIAGLNLRAPQPLLFHDPPCDANAVVVNNSAPIDVETGQLGSSGDSETFTYTLTEGQIIQGFLFPTADQPLFYDYKPKVIPQLVGGDNSAAPFDELREAPGRGYRFRKVIQQAKDYNLNVLVEAGTFVEPPEEDPTNPLPYLFEGFTEYPVGFQLRVQILDGREEQVFWDDDKGTLWFRRGDVSLSTLYEERWKGICTPWLDGGMGGAYAQEVQWNVNWPAIAASDFNPPGSDPNVYTTVSFGDTLTRDGYKRIEVLYNDSGAVLVMPWKTTFVDYGDPSLFPIDFTQTSGQLPKHIQVRLEYDIVNNLLVYNGVRDEGLIGIMSPEERDLIKQTFFRDNEQHSQFRDKIDELYEATQQDPAYSGRTGYTLSIPDPFAPIPGDADYEEPSEDYQRLNPEWRTDWGVGISGGNAKQPGWIVIGYNGREDILEPSLVEVIRLTCPPDPGQINVILPDCPFDEQVTLRWTGDCGGDCSELEFYWQFSPGFNPDDYADVDPNATGGEPPPTWEDYIDPLREDGVGNNQGFVPGQNEIIIRGANLRTLTDNWYRVRFRDPSGQICGASSTSDWTDGQLAEGWVKRVKRQLNPFDQRIKNFSESRTATYVSMIEQLGEPYQDRIAFTCDPEILNAFGLIEVYQAVLYRAKSFTIAQGVKYPPANQALILMAGALADFHMLLGNEAYGDSLDPTIALDTDLNASAASMFAFQDQLPSDENSLLYEELALMRGRDGRSLTPIDRFPVYNRLYWNFTSGDGQVAYRSNYNIQDVAPTNPDGSRGDGFLNEEDARVTFPQGHGDAWGQYLTAIKYYYDLLRDDDFDWPVRTEAVLVDNVPIRVSFAHERKFARAAAAKAKAGLEILNLTYREQFTEDPNQQWRGYEDYVEGRHWGVTDWAKRAYIGAYYDWVVTNANIPSEDNDPDRRGTIAQVDRSVLPSIRELVSHADEINAVLTQANRGLNPLGLAKNVVPFDLKPGFEDAARQSQTHFEQVYDRAKVALSNAVAVFDYANQASVHLRRNQDSAQEFENNIEDAEMDYNSRLIEIFGYPFPEAINPRTGEPFGIGYNGPDLDYWFLVDAERLIGLTGENELPAGETITVPYKTISANDEGVLTETENTISYTVAPGFGMIRPRQFTLNRRAPGEIQLAQSDLILAWWQLRQAVKEYQLEIQRLEGQADYIESLYGLRSTEIGLKSANLAQVTTLNGLIIGAKTAQIHLQEAAKLAEGLSDAAGEAIPTVVGFSNDAFSAARAVKEFAEVTAVRGLTAAANTLEVLGLGFDKSKEVLSLGLDIGIQVAQRDFERETEVRKLNAMIRELKSKELEIFSILEEVNQASGRYQKVIAEGTRLLEERDAFRAATAEKVSDYRYKDMSFRIFRNDALQKYRAQFDLAARYSYLSAKAYGYETNLVDFDERSGEEILQRISRERTLGNLVSGEPQTGAGLSGILAELNGNFQSLRGLLGFNNPTLSTDKFSLRREWQRIRGDDTGNLNWVNFLQTRVVTDLRRDVPEFKQFCVPFEPYSTFDPDNPDNTGEPAIVLEFGTTIQADTNFFGREGLKDGGESFYPSDHYAIKIRGVGIWFTNYNDAAGGGLVTTPRCYLVPIGVDLMRIPFSSNLAPERRVRAWNVVDQVLPIPFALGAGSFEPRRNGWLPEDQLPGTLRDPQSQRYASIRAYHDGAGGLGGIDENEFQTTTNLIGRSVWNTRWMLIIPGRFLLQGDPHEGIQRFIEGVQNGSGIQDIRLAFQTYQYASGAAKVSQSGEENRSGPPPGLDLSERRDGDE